MPDTYTLQDVIEITARVDRQLAACRHARPRKQRAWVIAVARRLAFRFIRYTN